MEKDNNFSRPRNKLLAEAFYLVKLVEKYGSGFVRIREILNSYPAISYNIQEVGNGFLFVLQKTTPKITLKEKIINLLSVTSNLASSNQHLTSAHRKKIAGFNIKLKNKIKL